MISSGLIVHLDASNAASTATPNSSWIDLSGNDNHGDIMNGVSFENNNFKTSNASGRSGVRVGPLPTILKNTHSFTVVVKVTPQSTSGNILGLSSSSDHGGWNAPVIPSANSKIFPGLHNAHGQFQRPFVIGTTYEYVYSFNHTNNEHKFYENGELVNTRTVGFGAANSSGYLFLGDDNPGCCGNYEGVHSADFAGDYERLLVYDQALTDQEITGLYQSGPSGIEENSVNGTLITTLSATDQDTNNTNTYSLVDGAGNLGRDNASVTVSGTQILVNGPIDYETTPYLLINVQVNDGTNTLTSSFTLTVLDVNDNAPSAIVLSNSAFVEGLVSGSSIATLTSVDADTASLNTFSYSLIDGDGSNDNSNNRFTINGNSLISSGTFDYETTTSHNIYVQVNDGANTYNQAFTLTIINQNDPPTDIELSTTIFDENMPMSSAIAVLTAEDQNADDVHTFTLTATNSNEDDDNGSFTVSGTQLLTNDNFDFETKNSYNIHLKVSDGTGTTDYYKAFTITVSDINEVPTKINFSQESFSNNGLILHLDSGNSSSYPGSGNTWYDLSENNYNAVLMNSPSYSSSSGGLLSLNGSSQWIQLNSFAGVLTNNSAYTISIWFKSTETNPSGGIHNNAIFSMHTANGDNRYRIGAAPDANRGLYYNFGTGSSEGRVSQINLHDNQWHNMTITKNTGVEAQFYIDDVLRTSNGSITNGVNFNGVGQVSIGQEYDGGNTSDHFQGDIPVVMVYNKALEADDRSSLYGHYKKRYIDGEQTEPVSSEGNGISITENTALNTFVGTLQAEDQDSNNTFTYGLVDGAGDLGRDNASVTVSGTQILVNGPIDYETTPYLLINVQVNDGLNTLTSSFTININDLNDTPPSQIGLSTTTFAEDITNGSIVATLSATDADTASLNSFSYSLIDGDGSNDSSNNRFTISGNSLISSGTFDYETASSHNIYVQVNDGANTYSQAFTLTIINQNDTPTDIALSNTAFLESVASGSVLATITTTDQDTADTHAFTLANSGNTQDDDNGSFTVSGTRLITNVAFDYETKTSYNIYLKVSDGTSDYYKAFTLNITNVNEAPTEINFIAATGISIEGLVVHLDAANPNSYPGTGNTWFDLSGNENHFNKNTATFVNSGFGYMDYNSDYSHSNTSINTSFEDGYTAIILMKYNTFSGGSFQYNDSPSYINFYNGGQNKLRWETKGGNAFYSQNTLNTNKWYLFAGTHEGITSMNQSGSAKIYINGALDRDVNLSSNPSMNAEMRLGEYAGALNGSISAFLFYDRELTAAEITEVTDFYNDRITGGVNSNSSIGTSTSVSIEEGTITGEIITALTVSDQDTNNTYTYSLVDGAGDLGRDNASVTVSGTQILVNGAIDYETTPFLLINVQVNDGENTLTSSFTITVVDVNDNAPSAMALSTTTLVEDLVSGTTIATLASVDADTSSLNIFSYSLIDGDGSNDSSNNRFTISGNSLISSGTFDYETASSHNIYVQVNDGANTYSQAFTLTIINQNDTPTDITLSNTAFLESVASGSVLATITTTDQDTTDTHAFTLANSGNIQDDDNGSFTVSGTTLITQIEFDYETKTSYNIYLKVSDGTSDYYKAFTLTVSDTNDSIPSDINFGSGISTDGLILHLDAANVNSYDGTGNTWYDLSGNGNDATLIGPEYNTDGYFEFDGNDIVQSINASGLTNLTIEVWMYDNISSGQRDLLTYNGNAGSYTFTNLNNFRTDGNGLGASQFPTTLISNQWTRFAYVKNQKIFVNNTKTLKQAGNDNPYGSLSFGNARSDVNNKFRGKISKILVYQTALTDDELDTNYTAFESRHSGGSSSAGGPSISINDNAPLSTVIGTMQADDEDTNSSFTFSLVSGNGITDADNDLFVISSGQLILNASLDYQLQTTANINMLVTDGANTFVKSFTFPINDKTGPRLSAVTIANNNASVAIQFDEATFNTSSGSGSLISTDFVLSIVGGTASLTASVPSSMTFDGSQYTLVLPIQGYPDGNEVISINVVSNSIFDALGNAAVGLQNNSITLNADTDQDGIVDLFDACPATPSGETANADGCSESQLDPDNDSVFGEADNCPFTFNPNQVDTDGDGIGDICDSDDDNDGIPDGSDNCPLTSNNNQEDSDLDGIGNACDSDNDNDGVSDAIEIAMGTDPLGEDSDGDGYGDGADAFPTDPLEWLDTDGNGVGNNTDADDDNDGYSDADEVSCGSDPLDNSALPDDFDADSIPNCIDTDDDNDGFIDSEDDLPLNTQEWIDTDGDTIGDNADPDDDNDSFLDENDAFPLDSFEWLDTDKDGIGNNTDTDDDGDDYYDDDEIECGSNPLLRWSRPDDFDRDLIPDCIDQDDDNDECLDEDDVYPLNPFECLDTDGDGFGDNADWDADNDGVHDNIDAFPNDPNESKDTDGDGIGDNADPDKNNDGYPDDRAFVSTVLTPRSNGIEATWRIVNIEMYSYSMVKVFSPDGSLVFKDIQYQNDWKGAHYKTGKALPTGPYLYQIYIGEKQEPLTGWVYIFN